MMKTHFRSLVLFMSVLCLYACNSKPSLHQETTITDYSDTQNWLKSDTASHFAVDVFYLYPTVWIPTPEDGLYCELDNVSMRKNAPLVYESQAKIFEDIANVYAPWYRQADAKKILNLNHTEIDAHLQKLPYQDALAAFEYYLEHYNQGKPFILAGHSQGSAVLKLILKDYMKEHPEVLKRMIAAYPLGYSYEDAYFIHNPHLKFAKGETDTGVIVSWNCERKENGKFAQNNNVCFPGAMAINPVTWKHDYKKAEANDARYLGSKPRPDIYCSVQVQYDSIRDLEVLILGIDNDKWDTQLIGDQNLHGLDFSLFTENIKENAKKRIDAFFGKK